MTFAQPFSDYEVLERVGAGSMGTVFRAHHKKLNRTVALKVLKPSLARDARYVDRLRREARIVASLNHPNIVTGYDVGQEGGYHYFVMEFVEGKSLRELLNEWGLFAEERVLDVAIQITTALDHAFAKGVIHRDIKPANILIDNNNVVKLTDMGLAKGPDNLTITRDGAMVGTPQYISPEQAKSPQDVDVRSDLYSLGATLFHMCTGQPPFRAETMANVLIKVLEERAPSAAGINPDLSDGLNLIIRKLLSKDPGRRYQTPAELLDDLERVRRSELPDVDLRALDLGASGAGRKRWLYSLGVAVSLVVLISWWAPWAGEKPEIRGPDPVAEFRDQLDQELRSKTKVGEKLKHIRLRKIGATGDQLAILATRLEESETKLIYGLQSLFSHEQSKLPQTFDGLGWREPEGDLKRYIDDLIQVKFAILVPQLPLAVGREYETGWLQLSAGLPEFTRARVDRYRRAIGDQTLLLRSNQHAELWSGNIRGAESKLRVDLGGYDHLGPGIDQLPADLRMGLSDVRGAAERTAMQQLETREGLRGQGFESALVELDGIRDDGDIERLAEFVDHLETDYPKRYFRDNFDPWPDARKRIAKVRSDIASAQRRAERATIETALKLAYEFAVDGDLVGAGRYLGFYEYLRPDRIAAHRKLLDGADQARARIFEALLPGSRKKRPIPGVLMRGGRAAQHLEVRRQGTSIALWDRQSKVSLALMSMKDLVLYVGGDTFLAQLSGDEKAGLALWHVLSGDKNVVALIPAKLNALFRNDILEIDARAETPRPVVARNILRAIQEAVREKNWASAAAGHVSLLSDHAEFAADIAGLLDRYKKTIDAGNQRSRLLARLRQRARPFGMQVEDDDDKTFLVKLDMRQGKIPEMDRRGWTLLPGQPIRFMGSGVNVKTACAQALVVPTFLDVDEPLTLTLEMSFESENGGPPRVVFVQCHGVTVGIGLQRNGVIVLFPVDRALSESRVAHLQPEIGKAIATTGSPVVVPGARHRFVFQLRRRKGKGSRKWVVDVAMDGEPLSRAVVQRAHSVTAGLTVNALEPVTVHSVEFRGRG